MTENEDVDQLRHIVNWLLVLCGLLTLAVIGNTLISYLEWQRLTGHSGAVFGAINALGRGKRTGGGGFGSAMPTPSPPVAP